jgi:hypothetical protein
MIAVGICQQSWPIPETIGCEFPLRGIASLKIQQIRFGSGEGARINGLLVGRSGVQFDKIDQHRFVRRLTVVFGLGKNGALVGQRDPCPQLGLPIPQRGTIGLGLCQVILQPLLVA